MESDFESLYQVATPTLELGDELARGLTSVVYRATYYGLPVAMKRFLRNVTPELVARRARPSSHHGCTTPMWPGCWARAPMRRRATCMATSSACAS